MGYCKKRLALNSNTIEEIKKTSEFDPTKAYIDEDEKYVESLSPMERKGEFKIYSWVAIKYRLTYHQKYPFFIDF